MSEFDRLLVPFRRKYRLQFFLVQLQYGLLYGSIGFLLWIVVFRLFKIPYPWFYGFGLILLCLLSAVFYGLIKRIDIKTTTRLIDKNLRLKEKIQTGWEYQGISNRLVDELMHDCRETLQGVKPSSAFPLKLERNFLALPLVILLSILCFMYIPPLSAAKPKPTITQESDVVKELKELKEFYNQKKKEETNPILAKKYDYLEKRLEKLLEKDDLKRKDALNELKFQMDSMKEDFSKNAKRELLQKKLEKLGQELKKNKEMSNIGQQMEKRDWNNTKKEMNEASKKFEQEKGDKSSLKEAVKELEKSANDLKSSDPKMADQMQKLSEQLSKNQQKQASQTMKELEKTLDELAKKQESSGKS